MLRVCEKLREADAKGRRYGLARAETGYLRALVDAMADVDRLAEVELLKSLGDVNLEKGRLEKDVTKFRRALVLYMAAVVRCDHLEQGEGIEYRYEYAERLLQGVFKGPRGQEQHSGDKETTTHSNVARKFQEVDRKRAYGGNTDFVLVGYAQLMVEGIVNENNMLETEAIKSIGDVYLKRGTETRDTRNLTRASALYNLALTRCHSVQGTVVLVHRLLHTAKIRQDIAARKAQRSRRTQLHQDVRDGKDHFSPFSVAPSSDVIDDAMQRLNICYHRYLQTADRDLENGDLDSAEQNLAAALKLVHDPTKPDRAKEANCLCKLGDVYVERGKRAGEGRTFTQAAALYNASMARTDGEKQHVITRLQETERQFLRNTCKINYGEPCPYSIALDHIKELDNMRARAKSQLEIIHKKHNPYQCDEDDPVVKEVEIKRAEAIKNLFKSITVERQAFIQVLTDECIAKIGPPTCKYAFIGLGSQATELVTPYSDLEFAILIEEGRDDDDTRRYFLNLTHFLHLKVINLGETILPAMAIPSLNDFLSEDPENDWFFDSVTPRGFAFDGFMPWASKTPFGRDETKCKPSVSLIQTPAKLAKYQYFHIARAEGYHLSDILRRVTYLTGDESLVDDYTGRVSKSVYHFPVHSGLSATKDNARPIDNVKPIGELLDVKSIAEHMDKVNKSIDSSLGPLLSRLSATSILEDNVQQIENVEPTGQLLDVKKEIYRFPIVVIDVLSNCCGITVPSVWRMIEELHNTQRISQEDAHHLTVLISISAELRLRTYIANGGQKDRLSPLTEMKIQLDKYDVDDSFVQTVFYIPDSKMLLRYYYTAIPLKRCIVNIIEKEIPATKIFPTDIFDSSSQTRGRIAQQLFQLDASISYFEAALKEASGDEGKQFGILSDIGNVLQTRGDCEKAMGYYRQALRVGNSTQEDRNHAALLNNIGHCFGHLGDKKKAMSYYEQSLKMKRAIYGDATAHPDIASSLHNIGTCWSELGDQKKAFRYLEPSLKMKKAIYGHTTAHPDITASLSNIGACWSELGDERKAISYYEQSLKMTKSIYGNNTAHPDVARLLNNIGCCWNNLGNQRKAISYYEQSLKMMKAIYGETTAHPDIALSLNNIGACWNTLGDQMAAISRYEQSLKMMKAIYDETTINPYVASSLNNIGNCWLELGDQKKAIRYHEQSLKMKKAIHGETTAHPDIAASLNNIGNCWSKLGDQRKAIRHHEQSLKMKKAIYGETTPHPDIAGSLNNIGKCWGDLGEDRRAISYYEQSLRMIGAIHGETTVHPDTAALLNNIGSCWIGLGDQRRAIRYYEQSLKMMKAIYGKNTAHPDIAASLNNIGRCWSDLGDQRKSIRYYEYSLSMRKSIYGETTAHPDIDSLLYTIGTCWCKLGDHRKAIRYFEQSLEMRKTMYGEKSAHPDISLSLMSIGTCWYKIGDRSKAIRYVEQSRRL